jgi:large subunit ribosomal protein L31
LGDTAGPGRLVRRPRFTYEQSSFTTRSTIASGSVRAEVCSECHPFYTGKQKILDTGGRVARFEARFGKAAGSAKK